MKITYLANIRIPTEKAHGVQVMKACEAFVRVGNGVELVAPNRRSPITTDAFSYYNIKITFPLVRLFTIDTVGWGRIGYIFQSLAFGLAAVWYTRNRVSDIIYGRDEIVLTVLGLLTRKEIVWESHDGSWNIWARYTARRAKKMIVVTEGAADFYKEQGVPAERLLAISNGIDLEDFACPESKETARTRLGLPLHEKIVLYIGRLDGWKGTDTLLEASKILPSAVRIVVIGGEREQVIKLSKKYPQVTFLGFKPYSELANNQAAADALVVPNTGKSEISVRFTSPLKLIAHLASNRPIVVSDLPSTRWVADGAALFVPPDNPKALAEGVERIFKDTQLAQELCAKAQEKVSAFSWSTRAEKIATFISQ